MKTLIQNSGLISGQLEGEELTFNSTIAEVYVVDGITATKTADKALWVDDVLTYTIVIANDATNPPFTNGTFVDRLDPATTLSGEPNAVTVDGVIVPYEFVDGLLTINDLPTVLAGESIAIALRVIRA